MQLGAAGLVLGLVWYSLACLEPSAIASGAAGEVFEDSLDTGAIVEDRLSAGSTHTVAFALDRGEYLAVDIEQRAIDVVVTVIDPRERVLVVVDLEKDRFRAEQIAVVAESRGLYRLDIEPYEGDGRPGNYQLRVVDRRFATEQDRTVARASKLLADAERLWENAARDDAVAAWHEALGLWREVGNQNREAQCLNNIGLFHRREGRAKEAVASYEQAIALWRQAGDWYGEAETRYNLGSAYRALGATAAADQSYRAALDARRQRGDLRGVARTLNSWASLTYHLGNVDLALEQIREGLEIRRSIGDRYGEAASSLNLGAVLNGLGRIDEALDHLQRALELARRHSHPTVESSALNNLAVAEVRAGDFQRALEYYQQGLEVARTRGELREVVSVLKNLGRLYERLGDGERALDYYRQALRLAKDAENREWQAEALDRMGWLNAARGDTASALRQLERALELSRAVGMRRIEAEALGGIGGIEAFAGDPLTAVDRLERALEIQRELRLPQDEAATLERLASVYEALGDGERADQYLQLALDLDHAVGNRQGEASRLLGIARLARDRGDLEGARKHAQAAVNKVEALRLDLASPDLRAEFLGGKADHYGLYVDVLMSLDRQQPDEGYVAAALEIAERARARSLLEALGPERLEIRRTAPGALLQNEERLRRQINGREWYRAQVSGSEAGEERARQVDVELEDLIRRYHALQSEIRTRSPAYSALTQPETLTLAEIQRQVVDAESVLLEYALGEESSFLWAVTGDSVQGFSLPSRETIERDASRVHALFTERNHRPLGETIERKRERIDGADAELRMAGAALADMLLGPVAESLVGRRLLIVADGALQYLPFGALPTPSSSLSGAGAAAGGEPLVVRHEIVYLPSASVLDMLRRGSAPRTPTKTVAVFADPVFVLDDPRVQASGQLASSRRQPVAVDRGGQEEVLRSAQDVGLTSFPRLRFSRGEADAIAALVPAEDRLMALDFAASAAQASEVLLGDYRYLHFATHTLLNSRHPELSGIVLSLVDEQGRAQDGFLRLHEIFDLDIQADLVVLSSCQTALGKEVRGEGLLGLARGFMYAGAPRIVASLWRVDDRHTTTLMALFYEGLLQDGMRPAEALRKAQLSMWQNDRPPYEWAGFVLQGEWR